MVRSVSLNSQHVFSPFSVDSYRAIWIASFCMNTGLFVQDLGTAWLMTCLSQNPLMVASLQTAAMLPFFLLALPAGAGADLIDRRKVLLAGQTWLIAVAFSMAAFTLAGHMNAWLLLGFVFMIAVGNAINSPAWNVVMPSLVPRHLLEPTISLTNAGYNLARGLGAVLGGIIVASLGSGWAFAVCGLGFVYMLVALCRWQYRGKTPEAPEEFVTAIRSGLDYVRHSPILITVLVRTVLYMLPVSVMWSLLPLLARKHLHITSTQYGLMVASFGLGTLLGAFLQPRLRQKLSLDGVSAMGTILFATAFLLLSTTSHLAVGMFAMLLCGVGWTSKNATLNLSVQLSAPNWIRARAYSAYLLAFQGSIAVGSVLWGMIASLHGMSTAFATAALLLVLELVASRKFQLAQAEDIELYATRQSRKPEPAVSR